MNLSDPKWYRRIATWKWVWEELQWIVAIILAFGLFSYIIGR